MNATRPPAISQTGDTAPAIAKRSAAETPPHAVAKTLPRKAAIRRVGILENQFLDALSLPQLAVG